MRMQLGLAALATLLLGAGGPSDLPVPSKFDLSFYATYNEPPPDAPLGDWETALKQALTKQSPDAAADSLAARFGLTKMQAREFTRLWLFVETDLDRKGKDPALRAILAQRYKALVAATNHMPIILGGAAIGLAEEGNCDPADFDALTAGVADKVAQGWLIARSGDCPAWYGRFIALAPDHALPALMRLSEGNTLPGPDQRALDAWLASDAAMARIAPADRAAVLAHRRHAYLTDLLDVGLSDRALAFADTVPKAERAAMFPKGQDRLRVTGDGLGFTLGSIGPNDKADEQYVAALAIAGRTAEAEAGFAALPHRAEVLAAFDCQWKAADGVNLGKCNGTELRDDPDIVIIDRFLHHAGEDPYPIAEILLSDSFGSGRGGAYAAMMCRLFADPQYSQYCGVATDLSRPAMDGDAALAELRASVAAVEQAGIPGYAASRTALTLPPIDPAKQADSELPFYKRPPVEPETPAFAKAPLPAKYRGGETAVGWSKDFAPLPEGFEPLRIGRDGARVAVISVSQNLDPTGEISAGGYWVHLSDDGGKHWRAPLYTGLAENFPYVVLPKSAMPLFDGDALTIAVNVALIDTRTISYPPVGLRTLRRENGLYLRVPIADLTRDSNGDGITDLAAHHLLLDKPAGAATPFLVGSDAASCTGTPDREAQAKMALLGKLFQVKNRAIIEPVDRAPNAPLMGGWRGAAEGTDRPILLSGDPKQFACLRPDRLMIVYSPADIARIEHFTPDFHTVELPPITFNRAGDRGFVQWSSGWTGGTYRMRLVDGEWKFYEISSWIT